MQFLKVGQVALRLNISRQCVIQHINAGHIEAVRVGKLWRISEQALGNYINKNTKTKAAV